MRWPLYFVSNKIKNSLHRVSLMPLDGCRRFGAIEFERHDNHEKTIQLYPGTVRVREAFVLRSIEVYPWFNDLVTACTNGSGLRSRAFSILIRPPQTLSRRGCLANLS